MKTWLTRPALILFLVVFSLGFLFIGTTYAQIEERDVQISISPENPEPSDLVTVKLTSYVVDLNQLPIAWYSGTTLIDEGIGKTTYTLRAGEIGTSQTIIASISGTVGSSIEKGIIIEPSSLAILWEAFESAIPPFYRGKALPANEGALRVAVIPNFKSEARNISYSWRLNGSAVPSAGGNNRDFFEFINKYQNKTDVVEVSLVTGEMSSNKIIEIPTVLPEILFYEKTAQNGLNFKNAIINNFFTNKDSLTLLAVPFGMSTRGNTMGNVNSNWVISDEEVNPEINPFRVTFDITERGGIIDIEFFIENTRKIFQEAARRLQISV